MIASYLNNSTQDKGDYVFLDYTHQICSKTTSRIHSCSQILDGKMQGPQSFPFSFKFPIATSLGSGKNGRPVITDCPIPQTFLEKGVNASIKYELSLVVVHGKLRLDSKCVCMLFLPSPNHSHYSKTLHTRNLYAKDHPSSCL